MFFRDWTVVKPSVARLDSPYRGKTFFTEHFSKPGHYVSTDMDTFSVTLTASLTIGLLTYTLCLFRALEVYHVLILYKFKNLAKQNF